MMAALIIWLTALLLYFIFWMWYVGFRKPLSKDEIEYYLNKLKELNNIPDARLVNIRQFLENDTGKSFVMVNSLVLKQTPDMVEGVSDGDSSRTVLMKYAKPFMKMMLKRGGLPIFQGKVAGKSFDVINIEGADKWEVSAINRFRSRRDMMEIITNQRFHDTHPLKLAALEKSIAYPVDPWFQLGGFVSTVALVLALCAALSHILLML